MSTQLSHFVPSRDFALQRLASFLPEAGATYAARRNYDLGPEHHDAVSQLSPYIRSRILTESDVLRQVQDSVGTDNASVFVQEVFWRTYWKGWMELRPEVWTQYQVALNTRLNDIQSAKNGRDIWETACAGATGIECFDAWAKELVATGYLHNHARMWFASIWIFTLKLPWELGADFFLRHLLDGDPASNTLGWRWVAGLQTVGKAYLAKPDNIEKFTNGRFRPADGQLATETFAIEGPPAPDRRTLPDPEWMEPGLRTGLLLHDDDLSPGFLLDSGLAPETTATIVTRSGLSPLQMSPHVSAFAEAAAEDACARHKDRLGPVVHATSVTEIAKWAQEFELEQIVTPYAPVGPNADMLRILRLTPGVPRLNRITRRYDRSAWPHATAGFFRFRDRIPKLLAQLGTPPGLE